MLASLTTRTARFFNSISSIELKQFPKIGDCLSLELRKDGVSTKVEVPLIWFRDHCRSASAYNHSTNQRKSKILNLLEESRIASRSAVAYDGERLSIEWVDGHKSVFDAKLLIQMLVKPLQKSPRDLYHLWANSTIGELPVVKKSAFSFPEFSRKFAKYGFVSVEGVDKTPEATEKFCSSIAPIHDTFFGAFWTFDNNAAAQDNYHEDTAYSNEEIGPHTDGTYFPQSPGIQVFHCLRPADRGGETVLVDAFAAAERLKSENPSAYRILTSTPIDHHYIEKGADPQFSWAPARPVIELSADGGYAQIRFNPYDRAPLRLSLSGENGISKPEEVVEFYKAYQAFSRICHDPAMALKIQLTPGTVIFIEFQVIFIDNLRVLHARTAFSGYRQMCGCYLSRDNLMAKGRLHLEEEIRLQA